jgi:hypothetical protein
VREIDAPDAATARARGALINMAEDKGTPVDVAKFIRDTGLTMDDIRAEGVNPKGQLAKKGLALSKLHPTLFQQVATGQFPMERGVVIGESGLEPEQQLALKQMLDQRETIRQAHVERDAGRDDSLRPRRRHGRRIAGFALRHRATDALARAGEG